MTVASTTNRKEYAMDAVTTSFATSPVVFYDTSDLVVQVVTEATGAATTLTENTHYTVTGGDGSTGTVNTAGGSSPYGAGSSAYTLVIVRVLPLTQPADLAQNDGSDAEVLERAFDRLTNMVQQLDEVDERAIKLALSETASTALTELPFDRASKYLAFGSSKELIATSGTDGAGAVPVSTFMETVLDDTTAAAGRSTLGAAAQAEADFKITQTASPAIELTVDLTALTASRELTVQDEAGTLALTSEFAYSNVAGSTGRLLLPRMWLSGLTYAVAADADHDTTISAGEATDATSAHNMILSSALTKQIDAVWSVGSAAGGLDTGAVANSTWYYIWLIKRSDTGVVDALYSTSSTAPTMPASYDYKRLIGAVITDSSANIVAYTTYETEGGGLELLWSVPTLDVDLTNTLTTTRRTDEVRAPTSFSTTAILNVRVADATTVGECWIYCPDQTDAAPSETAAPLANIETSVSGTTDQLLVRTSAAGLIAARSNLATVDSYRVSTIGFRWSRR